MKNKTKAKLSFKIIFIISFIAIVFISYSYGFLKYCTKLFDKDFQNVYGIVCKNTNIYYQYVKYINISDERIGVTLKQHTVPYVYIGLGDTDTVDFHSAFNIYTDLSEQYKDKEIHIYTGALGSSDCSYSIYNGQLSFNISCPPSLECKLSFYEILSEAMLSDKIYKISCDWDGAKYQFDYITEPLPINETITSLQGYSAYTDNLSVITAFQGLKSLNLYFVYGENNNITDMAFLNNLTNLEDLTLYADCNYIDMTGVQSLTLKQFTLYTDSYTEEFENQLKCAFPNAEVSIVSDYIDYFTYDNKKA